VGRLESPVPSQHKAFQLRTDIALAPQSGMLVRVANQVAGRYNNIMFEPCEGRMAKNQLFATPIMQNENSKNFLLQVVNLTAAPVLLGAGTKLGNIIPLLEFYHVNPTAKSY
jgi:hypothetical protein